MLRMNKNMLNEQQKQRGKEMLGRAYLWISERTNRLASHRIHRKVMKRNKLTEVAKRVTEWSSTAPTACLRSLIGKWTYAKQYGRKLASVLRRNKLNGD